VIYHDFSPAASSGTLPPQINTAYRFLDYCERARGPQPGPFEGQMADGRELTVREQELLDCCLDVIRNFVAEPIDPLWATCPGAVIENYPPDDDGGSPVRETHPEVD